MNISRCVTLLQAAADAVDPDTGKLCLRSELIDREEMIDALRVAASILGGMSEKGFAKPTTNRGRAWTRDEEISLVREFESGRSISELSQQLQRSSSAVQARLMRLGKLDVPDVNFEDDV